VALPTGVAFRVWFAAAALAGPLGAGVRLSDGAEPPGPLRYLPLDTVGLIRRVEGLRSIGTTIERVAYTATVLEVRDLAPWGRVFQVRYAFDGEAPELRFYRLGSRGIEFVASQAGRATTPQPLRPAPWVSLPRSIRAGTAWENAFVGPNDRPVAVTHRVASLGDTVTVTAGTFARCVRVDSVATYTFAATEAGDTKRTIQRAVTESAWHAPGVGTVKLVRTTKEAGWASGASVQREDLEVRSVKRPR
jgi:hypothetical protein